jgi:hypothetical protein
MFSGEEEWAGSSCLLLSFRISRSVHDRFDLGGLHLPCRPSKVYASDRINDSNVAIASLPLQLAEGLNRQGDQVTHSLESWTVNPRW